MGVSPARVVLVIVQSSWGGGLPPTLEGPELAAGPATANASRSPTVTIVTFHVAPAQPESLSIEPSVTPWMLNTT